MWVNKAERAWRRRAETEDLKHAATAAEARFAMFAHAVDLLIDDGEGARWLARHGITSRWCLRSVREGKTGAQGLSVLEGVVLAKVCSLMLDDPVLLRWMSHASPGALRALHLAAGGQR